MRHKKGVALVHLVLMCGCLVALAGCGNKSVVSPATSLTSATAPTSPTDLGNTTGFKLRGNVSTATGQLLPGATVRATWASGSASSVTVETRNMACPYEFTIPVPGDVAVRAEKDGYDTQEKHLTVNADTVLDFHMVRTLPSDQYHLTFSASSSCSLPAEMSQRQYTAGLDVDASGQAKVYLRGGTMLAFLGEAGFSGVREGDTLRFQVSDDEMAAFAFVEFLPGYRWLGYSGTITGRIGGDRIDAAFSGRVQLVQYPAETVIAECTAADHRMEFVR